MSAPSWSEPAPHPEIGIQYDSVHTIVAAGQQFRIPSAERVGHGSELTTRSTAATSSSDSPDSRLLLLRKGPFFRGSVREKAYTVMSSVTGILFSLCDSPAHGGISRAEPLAS